LLCTTSYGDRPRAHAAQPEQCHQPADREEQHAGQVQIRPPDDKRVDQLRADARRQLADERPVVRKQHVDVPAGVPGRRRDDEAGDVGAVAVGRGVHDEQPAATHWYRRATAPARM
jgi:hypothetical protein